MNAHARSRTQRLILLSLTLIGLPLPASAQGLMVTGYADFTSYLEDGGEGRAAYFDAGHFNLLVLGQIYGNLFASAEVEYEHAGGEINLEYGYIGYTGFKDVRIMAGKFLVPFGRFNKDIHASWINKMVGAPLGFGDVLPAGYNDVGVWVSGARATGNNGNRITLDGWIVNGLMGEDGAGIDEMGEAPADRDLFPGGGRDGSKAVGVRIGLDLAPNGIDVGFSAQTGNYSDDPDRDLSLTFLGVDAAARFSVVELRGEVLRADQESEAGTLVKTGGYLQAAFSLTSTWEPVIRYGALDLPGAGADRNQLAVGLNLYVSSASSVRVNYDFNGEKSGFREANDVLAVQFNLVF